MLTTAATQVRVVPIKPPAELAAVTPCLSASEHRLMANYRHQRRRFEFAAGRLALKEALLETRGSAVRISSAAALPEPALPAAQRMQILPDERGRPRLWVEGAVMPRHVSIAHAASWAAGACSFHPIGVDIVDIDTPTAIPDDICWLTDVEPVWRVRLRALLWGLCECLLKANQISAKTLWALGDVNLVPRRPANEIIARWPQPPGLATLEFEVEDKLVTGAFVALSRSAMLVVISMPAPSTIEGTSIHEP